MKLLCDHQTSLNSSARSQSGGLTRSVAAVPKACCSESVYKHSQVIQIPRLNARLRSDQPYALHDCDLPVVSPGERVNVVCPLAENVIV